jgi:hypothetical protein
VNTCHLSSLNPLYHMMLGDCNDSFIITIRQFYRVKLWFIDTDITHDIDSTRLILILEDKLIECNDMCLISNTDTFQKSDTDTCLIYVTFNWWRILRCFYSCLPKECLWHMQIWWHEYREVESGSKTRWSGDRFVLLWS